MNRNQYPPEVMTQASLDVAGDPEIGNPDLASRAQEVIAAGQDPFYLVSGALKNGRIIMDRAERIRREKIDTQKISVE